MRLNYRFLLLAPPNAPASAFSRVRDNAPAHRDMLADMQRLRGRVYLSDGAIQSCELDDEGRFSMRGDRQGWHLLLVDDERRVQGCMRYLLHPNTVSFDKLRVSSCALAKDRVWGPKVRAAVESELQAARMNNFSYVELGGWALSEAWRGSRAALEFLVGSYALSNMWGGCLGVCTATVRHGSSSMLRRIGGSSLATSGEELPSYDDPQYGCEMELLRFDSRSPSARFQPLISQLRAKLADTVAITPEPVRDWLSLPREVSAAANLGRLHLASSYR